MSHPPLPPSKLRQAAGTHPLSSGVLILEAAIATLVVSVFASSSPALFTARLTPPRATAAQNLQSPQNQIFSLQSPFPWRGASSPASVWQTSHPRP